MSPMMDAAVMADHFDSINKLPEGVAGVPNWRCVPGYQVQSYFRYYCGPGAKVPVKPDPKISSYDFQVRMIGAKVPV